MANRSHNRSHPLHGFHHDHTSGTYVNTPAACEKAKMDHEQKTELHMRLASLEESSLSNAELTKKVEKLQGLVDQLLKKKSKEG